MGIALGMQGATADAQFSALNATSATSPARSFANAKLNLNPYRLEFDEIITPNLAEFNFAAVNPNFKIADHVKFNAIIAIKFNPAVSKTAVSQNAK